MASIVVLEVKVGLYPNVFKFADKGMVTDMRLQPFRHRLSRMTREERTFVKEEVIRVDKLFAEQQFFEFCKTAFERHQNVINNKVRLIYVTADNYVHFLNSWLAIISHFGLDTDYDPEFVQLMDEYVLPLIFRYAYRKEYLGENQHLPPSGEKRTIGQLFSEINKERSHRHFHGGVYPDPDFAIAFEAFINKYNL